jgi:signal transduction histidine kinase
MRDSIARKVFTLAVILAAPLVVLTFVFAADLRVRLAAVILAILAAGLAWLMARGMAARINSLTTFVDGMLDQTGPRPQLVHSDDELGELTRSLSRMTPRIAELVNRLSMELTRREAVLASMTEAVLAVDAQLNLSYAQHLAV